MNSKAKRFCKKPNCGTLVEYGYCANHQQSTDTWQQKQKNRLYDRRWAQTRLSFLLDNPLCADCKEKGVIAAAEEVHHILKAREHPHLRLERTNLMALCKGCHNVRTARGE